MLARGRYLVHDVAGLRSLSTWIRDRIADDRAVAPRADEIDLCVHEAVANIVQHGYSRGVNGTIAITLEGAERGLTITIADDGHPFNPLRHPAPHRPLTLDETPDRGFGIDLIRSFADEVEYRREDDQNVLVLRFQEAGAEPRRNTALELANRSGDGERNEPR